MALVTGSNDMPENVKRKRLAELSAEEFFSHGLDSDISSSEEDFKKFENRRKVPLQNEPRSNHSKELKHKDQLSNLKDKDPEFYNFLKENDAELLEFDDSNDSSDESSDKSSDEEPNGKSFEIEVQSKPKSFEPKETAGDGALEEQATKTESIRTRESVTTEILSKLRKGLEKNSLFSLRRIMRIFHAAVSEASDCDKEGSKKTFPYKIESSAIFNSVVQICLTSVSGVLHHHLKSEKKSKQGRTPQLPSTSKSWSKVKVTVKWYLTDLLQLLRQLAEPSMVSVILRHVQDLSLYYACFPKITKMLIKRLVRMWSSSEEHVRVLAFLSIRKLALIMPQLLEFILKQLYVGFVKNVKFFTPKTKPAIIFMQNSLVEMFCIDHGLTYRYGFVYIRQMAIHLRNAISTKKKDSYQLVYNWQYVSCIHLWARVLSDLHNESLSPLIFPLVQVTLGVIRLIPTARFYPLRFHCIRALNELSKSTNTYIPIASYLVEILECPEFNRKARPSTIAVPDFACILKLPKSQLHTRSFQDSVVENICHLLLEHFLTYSNSISFPELIFPVCLRMKRFMKKTEVTKFSKKIKQIVDKLQESGHEVANRRSAVSFSPRDVDDVNKWELTYRKEKNSLQKFYDTWLKMRSMSEAFQQMEKDDHVDKSSDEDERPKKKRMKVEIEKHERSRTMPDDSEKKKRKQKNNSQESISSVLENEKEDLIEDFELSSSDED